MKLNHNVSRQEPLNEDLSLEQLFKEYYARLVYFSFQIVREKASAEDITQEAFIKYWNQREEVASHWSAVKNYLYSTVKNASLNVVRHQKVVAKYLEQQKNPEAEEANIINFIIHAEVLSEIYTAVASLPKACQQISQMGFLEGKKNQEIADELGISINTVKTQKQRALQLLRLRLNPNSLGLLLLMMTG